MKRLIVTMLNVVTCSFGFCWHNILYAQDTTWLHLATPMNEVVYLVENAKGDIFASSHTGLFRSEDTGNSWIKVDIPFNAQPLLPGDANLPAYCVGMLFLGVQYDSLYASRDDGKSWHSAGLKGGHFFDIGADHVGRVLVATTDGLKMSGDTGITWQNAHGDFSTVSKLAINSHGSIWAETEEFDRDSKWGNYFHRVYQARQLPYEWTLVEEPSELVRTRGRIIAITSGAFSNGLRFSVDDGVSWYSADSSAPVGFMSIIETSDGIMFGCAIGGVYISSNNGVTWIPLHLGWPAGTTHTLLLHESGYLFDGTSRGLYRTRMPVVRSDRK